MTGPRIAVIGAGPAGCALAAALCDAGVDVALVDEHHRPWTATYASWFDDLSPPATAELLRAARAPERLFAVLYDTVQVVAGRRHDVRRRYGVIDNVAMREALRRDGIRVVQGRSQAIERRAGGTRLGLDGGRLIVVDLVFDARGAAPTGSAQVAHGVFVPVGSRPAGTGATGACVLMDWSSDDARRRHPSFLYALELGDGRCLVEETSLSARPPVPLEDMRRRLLARVGQIGEAGDIEQVWIPLGASPPRRGGAAVAFGAAAGYVHPATGYSVAAALRSAPRVAGAVASALGAGRSGAALHIAASDAVWPAPMRRTRALHLYGLGMLEQLDAAGVQGFFDAFYALPVEVWAPYLRIDASPVAVARCMWAVAGGMTWRQRRGLLRGDYRAVMALIRP